MMRTQFIIFFSVAITLWASLNVYAYRSIRLILPDAGRARLALLVSVILLAASYIAGRLLERHACSQFSKYLIIVGSIYMGVLVYACIGSLFADITHLMLRIISAINIGAAEALPVVKKYSPAAILAFAFLMSAASYINAQIPRHTILNLAVNKDGGALKTLKIAAATDVHLGHIISNGRLGALVKELNAMNPDIIVFGGDLFDEDLKPVIEADMGNQLLELKAKYGVYAIYGNHEYIGGAANAAQYMTAHNVNLLRDSSVLIDGSFYLVGRDDYSSAGFGGKRRMSLREIMSSVDTAKPVIVFDHQPFNLAEVASSGADFQLSGHTHHGQLWPFNFITDLIYEVSSGYKRKNSTDIFVSNGYGTWGAPMRMGNRPEFLEINLTFK